MPIPYNPPRHCAHCQRELVADTWDQEVHLSTATVWCKPADCVHVWKRQLIKDYQSLQDFNWVCTWCQTLKAKGELETHIVRGVEVPK